MCKEGAQVSDMDLNDDPPNYEPPPTYEEVMKKEKEKVLRQSGQFVCLNAANTVKLPDSPPPPYRDEQKAVEDVLRTWAPFSDDMDGAGPSSDPTPPSLPPIRPADQVSQFSAEVRKAFNHINIRSLLGLRSECDCAGACSCALVRRGSLSATWSPASSRLGAIEHLIQGSYSSHPSPPESKVCNVKGSLSADNIFRTHSP